MLVKKYCCILINFMFYSTVCCDIINESVEQHLDLTSQLVKKHIKIALKENSGKFISEYVVTLMPSEQNIAFIAATGDAGNNLRMEKNSDLNYVVHLEKPQISQSLKILLVYSKYVIPHPEEIRQMDKQYVKYGSHLYFYSPYKTLKQSINIKLSSSNVISFTQIKPVTLLSNKLIYGPFYNIQEYANETLTIHFENESPFLTVKKLQREIEVSHWGNIAIKENIVIFHSGAKLKGSFSRYDFQKDGRGGLSAVKSIRTLLPSSAIDIFYRDGNGNISTSNMRVLNDAVELELRPRFPLFGGWKTEYNLRYNVPSFEYLYNKGDKYVLKIRIIDHIFDDMVIDDATVRIILPEGSSNIELNTPYEINRHENSLHYTYLDTVGRPVIAFSMKNLVQNHIDDFELSYNFSKSSLFQEPILIICFIFFIFLMTIACLRLDFSINLHKHKD